MTLWAGRVGGTALAPEVGQLVQLQGLSLTDNQLTTLPAELARLTSWPVAISS